jgi:hypothetical protein
VSQCAWVVIYALMAACSERTPTERERALERIPAQAHVIAVVDGPALSSPAFRAVVDGVRPHLPPTMGCVIDAAFTSEVVAAGIDLDVGATIVIVTRAVIANCPALSKLDETVYAATIGAGALAPSRAASILGDGRWERARPYVLREPFAAAAESATHRVIAVAQPDPIDAWIAIDSIDAAATERAVRAKLARYAGPAGVELGGKLVIENQGGQVRARGNGLTATELATLVVDFVDDAQRTASPAALVFTCPSPPTGLISCHDGTHYKVESVETLLTELAAVEATPVIAAGDIIGIRLIGDPPRVLKRDDVILGIDAHRIAEARQLRDLAPTFDGKAALAIRREGVEAVLELSE